MKFDNIFGDSHWENIVESTIDEMGQQHFTNALDACSYATLNFFFLIAGKTLFDALWAEIKDPVCQRIEKAINDALHNFSG